MDAEYNDQVLVCRECGNKFVWTATQQRRSPNATEPLRCPVCELIYDREQPNGHAPSASYAYTNGAGGAQSQAFPQRGNGMNRANQQANLRAEVPMNGNYISGSGHPLHGHHGERFTGQVKWFNDRKGFGFITLDDGVEIFVHYSGIEGEGYKTLKQGQRVEIEVEDTDKGPQACHVRALDEGPADEETSSPEQIPMENGV